MLQLRSTVQVECSAQALRAATVVERLGAALRRHKILRSLGRNSGDETVTVS